MTAPGSILTEIQQCLQFLSHSLSRWTHAVQTLVDQNPSAYLYRCLHFVSSAIFSLQSLKTEQTLHSLFLYDIFLVSSTAHTLITFLCCQAFFCWICLLLLFELTRTHTHTHREGCHDLHAETT